MSAAVDTGLWASAVLGVIRRRLDEAGVGAFAASQQAGTGYEEWLAIMTGDGGSLTLTALMNVCEANGWCAGDLMDEAKELVAKLAELMGRMPG